MPNFGRVGHRDDEDQHKLECLARYVIRLHGRDDESDLDARRRFISSIQLHRGKDFADRLREEVRRQWDAKHE